MSTQEPWYTDEDVERGVRANTRAAGGTAVRVLNELAVRRVLNAVAPTIEKIRRAGDGLSPAGTLVPAHGPACGAEHPTNGTLVPCSLPRGHGEHFSTTGCSGSEVRWGDTGQALAEGMVSADARAAHLEAERLAFTARLGFGDGVTEPAAPLADIVDALEEALSAQGDHLECPVICEPCGETLASTPCRHCNGSGCGPGTALGAYAECEWCAGVGKVHEGCVERSYTDLAAEVGRLIATLAKVHAVLFASGYDEDDRAARAREILSTELPGGLPAMAAPLGENGEPLTRGRLRAGGGPIEEYGDDDELNLDA